MASRASESPAPGAGIEILHNPRTNKGTAFTAEERERLGIRGLLPPRVFSPPDQKRRVLGNLHRKDSDIEKYIFLTGLQDRNEALFYQILMDNLEELLPIVYTPTVGEACRRFGHIFRRPRGLYVSSDDRGEVRTVLRNWPDAEVDVVVVTDGERILGLGDLGASGMGIPIGKLSLYTACAGIDPARALPVMLDVGTDNTAMRDDPMYLGLPQPRVRGDAYDALVEELVMGVQEVFPGALIQFEDFATGNAMRLLDVYRDRVCTFNDDIQGTAAVTLAGLIPAGRVARRPLTDQCLVFLGAGSAATGIAHLIVAAMVDEGLSREDALRRCWFVDSKGLVVAGRSELASHKLPFAHDHPPAPDLASAVSAIRPTTLIGVSGQPGTFTESVLRGMAGINERPIIFALSNPTSRSECTAAEAYRHTDGRAIFASGSPFAPVDYDGRTLHPGQGNNAYIFPGLGLGVIASGASRVPDEMFLVAARVLADTVTDAMLERGSVYPPIATIRDVSVSIAAAVASWAYDQGLTAGERPGDIAGFIRDRMYDPGYGG